MKVNVTLIVSTHVMQPLAALFLDTDVALVTPALVLVTCGAPGDRILALLKLRPW